LSCENENKLLTFQGIRARLFQSILKINGFFHPEKRFHQTVFELYRQLVSPLVAKKDLRKKVRPAP
jgi:hypothetical protein